jgi:hypothetical protein
VTHRYFVFLLVSMASGFILAISQNDFHNINQNLLNIYKFSIYPKTIEMRELYENYGGAFNVDSANKIGDRFIITLTGKILERNMSVEGYAIVACHEMGHILGGEPRQKSGLTSWSSTEGQADYFATNQCIWPLLEKIPSSITTANDRCQKHFLSSKKAILCTRTMMGIEALIDYFNNSQNIKASIHKKDPVKISKTLQKYPSVQCRVDTWIAGLFGAERPACWFRP